ncbi:hypothetical protein FPRO04_12591 [Fusarium proliferatum]|nr:hypothetical protein FPRO04_12591 [Fusarium proliferatum]
MSPVILVKLKTPTRQTWQSSRSTTDGLALRFAGARKANTSRAVSKTRLPFAPSSIVAISVLSWESGGQAKFEATLWWEARSHFDTEVEAYKRLKDLQGIFIPCMYASVRFSPAGPRTIKDIDDYCSVNGILLQSIPGWSLWDLPESLSSPNSQQQWTSIVLRAVQGAHEINKLEVILNDSCPRNFVVDADSHQPFIIDLAQCYFKGQLFKDWEHFSFGDGQRTGLPKLSGARA